MSAVDVVVALLMVAGLAGAALPFVPGTPLILAGALVYAFATDFAPIGIGRLVILGVVALLAQALAWVGAAIGTRHFGGGRWAVAGALVGAVVGLTFAPVGLVLGPLAGATLVELVRTGNLRSSARSGLGAVLGVIVGGAAHVALAAVMVALFYWWVVRG